jgi:uncharacterized membrane protein YphA (DoxX/SURF4 family)
MAGIGLQTIYYKDFPYMLIPPKHSWIPGLGVLAYISGTMLLLAGALIVFDKKTRPIALVLGTALLLIFCFYHVPYQFMRTSNYTQLGAWDNAEKELALSSGAFIIAANAENFLNRSSKNLMRFGAILFSITIISFGIDHFLYAPDVAGYIPSWISNRLFWAYLAGTALLGSGIAMFLKIRLRLFATLLGTMIFIWFIILHIPKSVASPLAGKGGEVTSAFLALAYSGIAFVIAGASDNKPSTE